MYILIFPPGFAPIHLAAMGGYNEIVRALVSEGADINKKVSVLDILL